MEGSDSDLKLQLLIIFSYLGVKVTIGIIISSVKHPMLKSFFVMINIVIIVIWICKETIFLSKDILTT